MKYWDITPVIKPEIAVFPGDTPFTRRTLLDFSQGNHLLLSTMESTLHLGAHADAPNHYHKDGKGIDQVRLDPYIGPCQVIKVSLPRGERIEPKHIAGINIQAERVLFRTESFPDPYRWNNDFNGLSPEIINYLAANNVVLVGIDTPSVDLADDKNLVSHQAIYDCDMRILEGIVLDQVDPGLYTLVALPLPIKDADSSPVRAILLTLF